jgi:outer membrane protein assembly factor BamE (lipoprotein component of BamABCDE complex)
MSRYRKILVVLGALLGAACLSTGTKINDPRLTAGIVVDQSRRSDVVALLGLPEKVAYGQGGVETWQYFQVTQIPQATVYLPLVRAYADGFAWHTRSLVLTFDKQGVVKTVARVEEPPGTTGVPY